jgi:arylsulfatase A-like enzyme
MLIFMTDQERGDVLHPDHPCLTPNASRLAREGILFSNAFCPTAHCCPSRATFFTGLYPSRHGIYNNVSTPTAIHRGLYPGVRTFGEWLKESGYRLAFSGKWHVSDDENPGDRGWEELHVTASKGSYMHVAIDTWRTRGLGSDEPRRRGQIKRPGWGDLQLYDSYESDAPNGYEDNPDYPAIKAAVEALPRLAEGNQPWVMYVGPLGPHDPFVVPTRFLNQYDLDSIPLPPNYHDDLVDKPNIYRRLRQQVWGQLTEDEVRDAVRHYWAYCSMMDAMFGEVLSALDRTGQADNTLVLRMSDHGEYCGAHGLFMKGVAAFREAYHIPVIARWPQGIPNPGRQVDAFVTLADFAPTFLELAELPAPMGLTGRSLCPHLTGENADDWPDAVFTQFNGVELYYTQRSVTTREFKYVYNGFDFDELYDLRRDPFELENLAGDRAWDATKRELARKMWQFAADQHDDMLFNSYGTVALAPWGPADAIGHNKHAKP